MKSCLLVILLLLAVPVGVTAQINFGYSNSPQAFYPSISQISNFGFQDAGRPKDTVLQADTVKEKLHSPKKAALMSAILPGLGQIYNKKYWKLGIIYPAMGGVVYGFAFNHKYFKVYRDALRIRYDGDSTTIDQFSLYSDDRVVTMKNYYQRYRDLCVIGFSALYVLQIIDAAVDAHLFYFDVGPDLSMNWNPVFTADHSGIYSGLQMRLRI